MILHAVMFIPNVYKYFPDVSLHKHFTAHITLKVIDIGVNLVATWSLTTYG